MLFLGSNIGNFDPPGADAFLRGIRAALAPGDALLLGADLVKPERELLLAYDDPLGVTAAFNRNLLVRINRELGGDFDLDRFAHRAVWNARRVARRDAPGQPPRAGRRVSAASDSTLHDRGRRDRSGPRARTSTSPNRSSAMLEDNGFALVEQWIDAGRLRADARRSDVERASAERRYRASRSTRLKFPTG